MKKTSTQTIDPARRSFLRAAGGAGVLSVLAANQAEAAPLALPVALETATSSGYHETEHIRRYYRTAAYW